MTDIEELTQEIMRDIVPLALVDDSDREVIRKHRDFLLALEDDMIQEFYDNLYAHAPTAAVFEEGERPAREESLRDWWRKTIESEFNLRYFAWMALVGVVHIRRKVQNPMLLSMFHMITDTVHVKALEQLEPGDAERLRMAFSHLSSTVTSVISEAYTKGYIAALQNLAGLDPKLTERMLQIEVNQIEGDARAKLA